MPDDSKKVASATAADDRKFLTLDYLRNGTPRQQAAHQALTELQITTHLRPYKPVLAGTIPIDIDIPDSDLDIICQVLPLKNDQDTSDEEDGTTTTTTTTSTSSMPLTEFARVVQQQYGTYPHFTISQRTAVPNQPPYVIASFQTTSGDTTTWTVEIFGQAVPVGRQNAYRHMLIEYRLLQRFGTALQRRMRALKLTGVKTEPAFCQVLGLDRGGDDAGTTFDPYQALLELEGKESKVEWNDD